MILAVFVLNRAKISVIGRWDWPVHDFAQNVTPNHARNGSRRMSGLVNAVGVGQFGDYHMC